MMFVMSIQYIDKKQAVTFILTSIQQQKVCVFAPQSKESDDLMQDVVDLIEHPDDVTSSLMVSIPVFDHIIDYLDHYSNENFKSLILYNLEIDEEDISFLATSNFTSSMDIYILK